jgi:hypothetical protein
MTRRQHAKFFILAAGLCRVVIRQTSYSASALDLINLNEVQLFDANGAPVQPTNPTLSSVFADAYDTYSVNKCFDGNLSTICHTDPGQGDNSPFLEIPYACPGGYTSLSRVLVANRFYPQTKDRINAFTLDFFDAARHKDRPSYTFAGGLANYTIWANSACL